jgi:hypothetical protein
VDTGSGSCGIVIFSFKEKDCRGRTIWRKIEENIGNPLPEQLIKGRKIGLTFKSWPLHFQQIFGPTINQIMEIFSGHHIYRKRTHTLGNIKWL